MCVCVCVCVCVYMCVYVSMKYTCFSGCCCQVVRIVRVADDPQHAANLIYVYINTYISLSG